MKNETIEGVLARRFFGDSRTFGAFELLAGGRAVFACFTCEDAVRGGGDPALVKEWKMQGKTAIPYGTYKVKKTHSPKYGRDMWQLMDVPGFEGIRIHSGNTERDTEGCILLGRTISPNYDGIEHSRDAVKEFEAALEKLGNPEWELEIRRENENQS